MKPLGGINKELADRHANFPFVVARMLASHFGKEHHDDLLEIAVDQFLQNAARFDVEKSPQGEQGFGPYVLKYTKLETIREWKRHRRRNDGVLSLNHEISDNGETAVSLAVQPEQNQRHEEAARMVDLALDRLKGRERAAVVLRYRDGLTYREIGSRLGVKDVSSSIDIVEKGIRKLKYILRGMMGAAKSKGVTWQIGKKPHHKKWMAGRFVHNSRTINSVKRAKREQVICRLALGVVVGGFYILDRDNRTITGPYRTRQEAATANPDAVIDGRKSRNQYKLAALSALDRCGPLALDQLAKETGFAASTLRYLAIRPFLRQGLVAPIGHHLARTWSITDTGRQAITPASRTVVAYQAALRAHREGYTVIPHHAKRGS